MNSYAKFGGAARRHFSAICEKPMGAHMCPPGRARVNKLFFGAIPGLLAVQTAALPASPSS